MKLIGFNLNKISAEKSSSEFNGVKIENSIQIEEITNTKADFFKKDEEVLQVLFNYTLNYNPNIAKLAFSGNILLLLAEKEAKKILKQWGEKKLSEEEAGKSVFINIKAGEPVKIEKGADKIITWK